VDELRRPYHDRIAGLHESTGALVSMAADAVENVTSALVTLDPSATESIVNAAAEGSARVTAVEMEVLELLAQQAPLARDLRVILASQAIARAGELSLGLCRTLAGRAGLGADVLTESLRGLIDESGRAAAGLLRRAAQAWRVIDADMARSVIEDATACRAIYRRFLAQLLTMEGIAVEAAVDLGMAARAYERLVDHAVEIAGRVVFAATGELNVSG
jgi:phosphate transport system protein